MALSKPILYTTLAILFVLFFQLNTYQVDGCFKRIFTFGDSVTDTGNYWHMIGSPSSGLGAFPFGQTYFHRPTGRASDGRLIIDFIAQEFGFPLPPPALGGNTTKYFKNGANFALFGGRALDNNFFIKQGLNVPWTNTSLGIQMDTFKKLLPVIANGSDVKHVASNSLFVVGEIGGNDYNVPFFSNWNTEKVRALIPFVIARIGNVVEELINLGAKNLVVPGNFPFGCSPSYLQKFQSKNPADYEPKTGCLIWPNKFSEEHNTMLKGELQKLRLLYPKVKIIYADYYAADINIFENAKKLGFTSSLYACCGGPGAYNFSSTITCGSKDPKVHLCPDPSKYISWDGAHQTEATYRLIADGVLNGPYADPIPVTKLC